MKIFSISSSVHLQLMILYNVLECEEEWFALICCLLMSVWKRVHSEELYLATTYHWLINSLFVSLVFLIKKNYVVFEQYLICLTWGILNLYSNVTEFILVFVHILLHMLSPIMAPSGHSHALDIFFTYCFYREAVFHCSHR